MSFRGTMSGLNVRTDIDTHQVRYQNPCKSDSDPEEPSMWVHQGFNSALDSVMKPIFESLQHLCGPMSEPTEVCVCGHSLGGALAALCALRLASTQDFAPSKLRVRCYTFGQPRFGDTGLAELMDRLVPDYWRVTHLGDPVCKVLSLSNEHAHHS